MPFQLRREPQRVSPEPLDPFVIDRDVQTREAQKRDIRARDIRARDNPPPFADRPPDERRPHRGHMVFAAGLFLLLTVLGAIISYNAVSDFAAARASGNWRQVDGVVLSPDRGRGLLNFGPPVRYAYLVDGKRHESHRIAFRTRGVIGTPPSTLPGSTVTVHVSPDNPARAVLVPGGSGRRFAIWFAAGGFVIFVGFAGLIRAMMAIDFPELARHHGTVGTHAAGSVYSPAE